MMTIGYDAKRAFSNATGLGSYARTLINDLAPLPLEMRLYAPDYGICYLRRQIVRSQNIRTRYPRRLPFGGLSKAYWRSHGILGRLHSDGIQLYHGLSGELPVGISKSGIRSVVTIHDLIFLRHPEYYHWLDTKIYAWKFRQTVREADHIIAISECTKRDILHYAPSVDPSRITVIYQSCAPRFTHGDCPPCAPRYLLSVGSIETRKNILLAIRALPYLPSDLKLYIVGRPTPYLDTLFDYIREHRLEDRVRFLHNVRDDELPALYAQAEAFVYPSRYEGFGIPIIEAISSGLPVVACTGSCLEEAGGPDSLYVDPDDEQAFAQAVRQVLRGAEGREERIRRSRDYIRRFQGHDVAQQVYDLYQQLL
jgi:glycosyltransferase involved in cell wall biosynthesis